MSLMDKTLPFTQEFCDKMRATSIREIDREPLVSLNDVVVDTTKSHEDRVIEGTGLLKNPYFCDCEGYAVKFNYVNREIHLSGLLSHAKII
ncbi:MAG: hypothetical protein R3Y07_04705 [Eubacteriales bacterium]